MEPFRVEQIDHVEFFVPNQQEAAAWYEQVLGLTIQQEFQHWADGGPLMIVTPSGGTRLALFRGEPEPSDQRTNFRRVAFRTSGNGFLQFLDRLDELQLVYDVDKPVRKQDAIDHTLAFSIYFSDPYGHQLEVTTYDHYLVRSALS